MARLYDPLGYLAPFVIRAKILMQTLWLRGVDWDATLESGIEQAWFEFRRDLKCIESIRIPRWLHTTSHTQWELHGFCDASERAYAAALYVVVRNQDTCHVSLLLAKTRVASIKVLNVPRLELCAAVLLSQLISFVKTQLGHPPSATYCWSDSQVVLAWLRGHPSRWKTFTANRVSEIVSLIPDVLWQHVPSQDNPADCASRGLSAGLLLEHTLWWHGPRWLHLDKTNWPPQGADDPTTELEARRNVRCFAATTEEPSDWQPLFSRVSSLSKLIRILAYVGRWQANAKLSLETRRKIWLSASELAVGRTFLWRIVQRESFPAELSALSHGLKVPATSSLSRLCPFLGADGVLRVGGRLQNSLLDENEKHPAILHARGQVIRLLIRHVHHTTLHGGPLVVQSVLSRQFWIVRGRNVIRHEIRQCVKCVRYQGRTLEQQMGPLPAVRTRPARPFTQTGVDYAGPFWIKASPGRGRKAFKGYLSIFVCMVTKATHIEVVSDYSSAAFLAAFKRFTARRGLCERIYSDHGTTFKRADLELRQLFQSTSAISQEIAAAIASDGVEWVYIPPSAPNFGGLWEATVKACKRHLKRIVGESLLTFEEMSTLCTQIEACLNSRPLSALPSDGDDVAALTPGHFLIGAALISPPEPFLADQASTSALSRWHFLTLLRNQFWKRWSDEYLTQLQQRSRWLQPKSNLEVGAVVVIKNELLPPGKWLLGRVVQTYKGSDGLCRVALVRTATSTLKRPIRKLILLPIDETQETEDVAAGGTVTSE